MNQSPSRPYGPQSHRLSILEGLLGAVALCLFGLALTLIPFAWAPLIPGITLNALLARFGHPLSGLMLGLVVMLPGLQTNDGWWIALLVVGNLSFCVSPWRIKATALASSVLYWSVVNGVFVVLDLLLQTNSQADTPATLPVSLTVQSLFAVSVSTTLATLVPVKLAWRRRFTYPRISTHELFLNTLFWLNLLFLLVTSVASGLFIQQADFLADEFRFGALAIALGLSPALYWFSNGILAAVSKRVNRQLRGAMKTLALAAEQPELDLPVAHQALFSPRLLSTYVVRTALKLNKAKISARKLDGVVSLIDPQSPLALFQFVFSPARDSITLSYQSPNLKKIIGVDYGVDWTWERWMERLHPEDRLAAPEFIAYLFKHPQVQTVVRMQTTEGHWRSLAVSYVLVQGDGQTLPTEVVGTLIDVSEQQNRTLSSGAARQRRTTLESLRSRVFHKLGQPLNIIRMASENLLRTSATGPADPSPKLDQKLGRIVEMVDETSYLLRVLRLVDRLSFDAAAGFDAVTATRNVVADALTNEQNQHYTHSAALPWETWTVKGDYDVYELSLEALMGATKQRAMVWARAAGASRVLPHLAVSVTLVGQSFQACVSLTAQSPLLASDLRELSGAEATSRKVIPELIEEIIDAMGGVVTSHEAADQLVFTIALPLLRNPSLFSGSQPLAAATH